MSMGPFDSEQQARETPAVRAVYEAYAADPGVGKMGGHSHQLLMRACAAAGVSLGAYDRRILAWLAGFEPQVCMVVAGLISRAHEAGRAEAGGTLARVAAVLAGFDGEHGGHQYALEAIDLIVNPGDGAP